ncbi:DUF2690 domain-containing protein [Streptomyces clavuligerus]|uniref:DUF2690 domain-containing protein n=1 Tax=Streptomyces clavuligerus TaxID=1901 RepID=UPI0001852107|nr:DUF2690 domain-containing protein [Streptomyces clavuligerus]
MGAIVVAVVGTVVSVGVGALVNGGTDPAPEDNRPTPAVSVRAVAKPTCAGEVCHGLDPRTTHCDADALTVKEEWKDVMRLELRYSARCSTVWGKLTGAGQGDTVTVSSSPTRLHRAAVESGRTKYTPMLAVDVRSGGQELSLQAVAVAVNGYPEQQIPRGHELRISAGPGDLRP